MDATSIDGINLIGYFLADAVVGVEAVENKEKSLFHKLSNVMVSDFWAKVANFFFSSK